MSAVVAAFVAGVVVGVFFAAGWATVWSLGDAVVDRVLAPSFDAHADEAIAVTTSEVSA